MIESRRFGPHADDAQGMEHWAAAGATALAAVVSSSSPSGEIEGRGGRGGGGGARVVVWWAGPDGGWCRSQLTAPCCCSSEEEGEEGEGGAKTPSPSKGEAAAESSSPSPSLIAADVAASADGGLRVLTLSNSCSSSPWNASVVAVYGDPTAVSDSGRALSPWSPPRRVGGGGKGKRTGGGSIAPAPGSRAAPSRPIGAVFVPGTGGSSVLLSGLGEGDGSPVRRSVRLLIL